MSDNGRPDDLDPDAKPRTTALAIADDREPWEKQPGESRPAFANFVLYRDLGPRRSLSKAAADSPRTASNFADQSRRNGWVARAEAYDDYMDRRYREERENELLAAERQEAQLGRTMTALAARRIIGDPQHGVEQINPGTLTATEAAHLAEAGIRIRRLAMGQPTDVLRGQFTITSVDLKETVEAVYDILMRFVPDERQPRAAGQVQLFFTTGRTE